MSRRRVMRLAAHVEIEGERFRIVPRSHSLSLVGAGVYCASANGWRRVKEPARVRQVLEVAAQAARRRTLGQAHRGRLGLGPVPGSKVEAP